MYKEDLAPKEYFNLLKEKRATITDKELLRVYDNCLYLFEKYKKTGQIKGMKKLIFHLEAIEKELEVVRMGVNTFVYKDDIESYIDNVADKVVKIIELEHYERDIPDEIVDIIAKTKHKFDQMYVVFTDYTGDIEKQVTKERREKDPILFGTFQDRDSGAIVDRFYYLGDWVDEYCDLTLDKMVNEFLDVGKDIKQDVRTPRDLGELKEQLNQLEILQDGRIMYNKPKRKGFFKKIKTFLMR